MNIVSFRRALDGVTVVADQDPRLRLHRSAFAHQKLVGRRDGWRAIGRFAAIPDSIALERCVLSDRYRESVLGSGREARQFGFSSTPASIVGRQPVVGSISVKVLDSLIGVRLAELRASYK